MAAMDAVNRHRVAAQKWEQALAGPLYPVMSLMIVIAKTASLVSGEKELAKRFRLRCQCSKRTAEDCAWLRLLPMAGDSPGDYTLLHGRTKQELKKVPVAPVDGMTHNVRCYGCPCASPYQAVCSFVDAVTHQEVATLEKKPWPNFWLKQFQRRTWIAKGV